MASPSSPGEPLRADHSSSSVINMLIKLHCPRHTLRVSFFSARYRSPSHLGAHPTEPHAAPAFGLQLAQHLQGMTGYNITGMYNKVIRSKEFDRAQDAVDGFVRLTDRNYNSLVSRRPDRFSPGRSAVSCHSLQVQWLIRSTGVRSSTSRCRKGVKSGYGSRSCEFPTLLLPHRPRSDHTDRLASTLLVLQARPTFRRDL